jgi:aspartyl-tRNA(Asn)/glutamyl-tRNA(Gln) amidotransferase subunit C
MKATLRPLDLPGSFPTFNFELSTFQLSPECYNPSMSLTLEQVEHIANLARLELSDEEKERYRQQLSAILDYFAQLSELDTAEIAPTSSVLPARSALRPDEPHPGLSLEELLRNAPETEGGQFRVPPVLE